MRSPCTCYERVVGGGGDKTEEGCQHWRPRLICLTQSPNAFAQIRETRPISQRVACRASMLGHCSETERAHNVGPATRTSCGADVKNTPEARVANNPTVLHLYRKAQIIPGRRAPTCSLNKRGSGPSYDTSKDKCIAMPRGQCRLMDARGQGGQRC